MKLFIFGSTGDLVKNKVLPALHEFKDLNIYVLGRKSLDNEQYNKEYCKTCSKEFKLRLNYMQVSFEKSIHKQTEDFLDKDGINYFYISMPPDFIIKILNGILEVKEKGFKVQILIEKPFGSSLKEAESIAKIIEKDKLERNTYLSDHYLFKKNIFSLNKKNFKKLKLVSLEKVGLEGRGYYDSAGALKDMIQSHFFNILHKITEFSEKDLLIKAIKLGQYKEYRQELGKESETETYITIYFEINGKEIEFETGKRYPQKESFIEIDGVRKEINSEGEDYVNLFDNFFRQKKENFPTIHNSIVNWKIIEEIQKKKPGLFFY